MTHHTVGYLGPPGTYSHAAALQGFSGCELRPLQTLEDVVRAVRTGEVERAVLPIENSTNGEVHRALDALVAETGECPSLRAVGELEVRIEHQVYAKPTTAVYKRLYSHPQVWGQISRWRAGVGAELVDCDSTSQAIERALADDEGAAVAGLAAGKLYGLEPAVADVGDCPLNTTRFLVLANAPVPGNKPRVLLTFSASRADVGRALAALAGVNITFLTSRALDAMWTYRYIVEVSGPLADAAVQRAVARLEAVAATSIIGAY